MESKPPRASSLTPFLIFSATARSTCAAGAGEAAPVRSIPLPANRRERRPTVNGDAVIVSFSAIRRERMYRDLAPVAKASRDVAVGRTEPANLERERDRGEREEREEGGRERRVYKGERDTRVAKETYSCEKRKKSNTEVCLTVRKRSDPRRIRTCCKR